MRQIFCLAAVLLATILALALPAGASTTCTTSAQNGACGPYVLGDASANNANALVIQDVWNPSADWKQTLSVSSAHAWTATANMATGNTAVVSYPDTQQTMTTAADTSPEASTYASLSSDFTVNMPSTAGTDAEAAYDIWLGDAANGNYHWELMIWEDNHGQTPGGSYLGETTIEGTQYKIYSGADNPADDRYLALVRVGNAVTGEAHLVNTLAYLTSAGYYPKDIGYSQIDFGFEICSTGGVSENFQVTSDTLEAVCNKGQACGNS
jgi:hypothetical protein